MLHISPETRQFLKHEQARLEAAERRRAAVAVRKSGRKLEYKRFGQLVDAVQPILRAGFPTMFEYEGACRQGLRVSLIRQGWSWQDADASATKVVRCALLALGAERPSWFEGQREFGNTHRVDRHYCARCGGAIDECRKSNGTPAKYCSDLCGNAARLEKGRVSGERVSLAEHLAELALKSAQTIRERSGPCEVCGVHVLTDRRDRRFCSLRCASAGRRVRDAKPCSVCAKPFAPRLRQGVESKYCSTQCRDTGRAKVPTVGNCLQCQVEFTPKIAGKSLYCSQSCSAKSKSKSRPEGVCSTCKAVFRWREAGKPQVYCSQPCNPRSALYVGRVAFKCEEVE